MEGEGEERKRKGRKERGRPAFVKTTNRKPLHQQQSVNLWRGDLPWSSYKSTEACTAGNDAGVEYRGSATSLRVRLDDGNLCQVDALSENGTTTMSYSKWEPVNCGSDIVEARIYYNCDDDCTGCDEEQYASCKSSRLISCQKS